ncbi:hypothetical protein FBU30_010050 [Linnemannia zychae]|nr:hypothetical protein FBU30_010050 [Linnemannia zychae]
MARRTMNDIRLSEKEEPNNTNTHRAMLSITHNTSLTRDRRPFEWTDIFDSDRPLVLELVSRIQQLNDVERSQRQIVVLLSDTLSPILRYHSELISELLRVLPMVERNPTGCANNQSNNDTEKHPNSNTERESQDDKKDQKGTSQGARVMTVILSPKPNSVNIEMLAEPFHLDLMDRVELAKIQIATFPPDIQSRVLLDDSWARFNDPHRALNPRGSLSAKSDCVQMLKEECCRLEKLLASVAALSPTGTGPLELQVVIEQPEAELHGVAEKLSNKVIFIVSKDREERPKSVALKTKVHWLDRMFLRAGYYEEWARLNLIPLYIQLSGEAEKNLEGQRPDSKYQGSTIHLTSKRPDEALTRVKVRQGNGDEVLEAKVLEEIERTKLFVMQAIRKPSFLERLGAMSLSERRRQGGGDEEEEGKEDGKEEEDEEANPFL